MNGPIWIRSVSVDYNGDFISIQAYSGYNSPMEDPTATEYLLVEDTSNEVLGNAVLNALKQSRFLSYKEACALEEKAEQDYIIWIKKLIARYGYKNKIELLQNMKNCIVERHESVITTRPSHHESLEVCGCEGTIDESDIKISASSSATEMGEALRIAFSLCTG